MPAFEVQSLIPGVLFELGQGKEVIQAFGPGRNGHPALFTSPGSFAGFVTWGKAKIETLTQNWELQAGSYFSARGRCIITGGAGVIVEVPGYHSIPELTGEVTWHRHLAGGRSVVLVPPGASGGPSLSTVHLLNGTAFAPQAFATPHAGLVAAGAGICVHGQGTAVLRAGQAFVARSPRCLYQAGWRGGLTLIIYEPAQPVKRTAGAAALQHTCGADQGEQFRKAGAAWNS